MRLLLVRHAIATDIPSGGDDWARPLSDQGRAKMRAGARGLRALVPELEAIGTSPLVRAVATAELVSQEYGGLPIEPLAALAPEGDQDVVLGWLRNRWRARAAATIAVVGHQPVLAELASWLLTGAPSNFVEFKKGGAALLDFGDAEPTAGGAWLCWLAEPAQLRMAAKATTLHG